MILYIINILIIFYINYGWTWLQMFDGTNKLNKNYYEILKVYKEVNCSFLTNHIKAWLSSSIKSLYYISRHIMSIIKS